MNQMFSAKYGNLVDMYQQSVRRFPERPIFGTKKDGHWRWMTYGEFNDKVDAFRAGLSELGVVQGDRVGLISDNRPEWAITAYATYGLGAVVVPMYLAQLERDWKFILGDCTAKVVVVATESAYAKVKAFAPELPHLKHIVLVDSSAGSDALTFTNVVEQGRKRPVVALQPESKDMAGLIYTSGTTGNPKGVMLSHGNFISNVSASQLLFPTNSDDRVLSFLPWAHSLGQTGELHYLVSVGASMGIAEALEKTVANLAEVKPSILCAVPRVFNRIYDGIQKKLAQSSAMRRKIFDVAMTNATERKRLAKEGEFRPSVEIKYLALDRLVFSKIRERLGGRLKFVVTGGAAISPEVAEFIDNLGITVYEGYGLTETTPVVAVNCPGARKMGSVGRPIPGVRVVIDPAETGDEKQGEIVVYGPNVMLGYYNLPEETKKVFTEDGGLRTGDLGYLDDDGYLFITGRLKEQYKLENGKYVVPSPLEEQLTLSSFIANAMVYGDNRPYNVALVIPDFGTLRSWATSQGIHATDHELLTNTKVREMYEREILKHSSSFRPYEKIKRFAFGTEDFTPQNDMLTHSLKIKRRVVFQRYQSEIEALY